MTDTYDKRLVGEKHQQQKELPEACSYALRSGNAIDTVNLQTKIKEILGELQTALSVDSKVAKARKLNACYRKIITKPR